MIVASSRLMFPDRRQLARTDEVRIRLRRDPKYREVDADRRTGLEQVAAGTPRFERPRTGPTPRLGHARQWPRPPGMRRSEGLADAGTCSIYCAVSCQCRSWAATGSLLSSSSHERQDRRSSSRTLSVHERVTDALG